MHGTPNNLSPATEAGHAVLAFLHDLLRQPPREQPALDGILEGLAGAYRVPAAGLASVADGVTLARHPGLTRDPRPWDTDPTLLGRVSQSTVPFTAPRAAGGSFLITGLPGPEGAVWVLWLEHPDRDAWPIADAAALDMAAALLGRRLASTIAPRWADQLDRLARQQRLETAAGVTRRLAHDFGNILTGILGFTELALSQQIPANAPLHAYLSEVFRSAQGGATFTQQLRLFSRRQSATSRSTTLAAALTDEEARLRPAREAGLTLNVEVPANLPPVALDGEQLRQILGALLDNAAEALGGPGAITVSARLAELSPADALDFYGDVRAGPHVEVCVADTGGGLTPEAQRNLFSDPFFTTKPRRRGFGLAVAYGVLHAHRGGIRLHSGERGVVARFVVPVAPSSSHAALAPLEVAPADRARGERILVVDDDPMILQFVTATLDRAGYRVQTFLEGEEALRGYFAQPADPYRLVLTDVVMPRLNGVDLVRRLLKRDPAARVLFMSGHVNGDFTHPDFAHHQFELLTKPFRPEGLLRAVRAALDRPAVRRGPTPVSGGGTGEGAKGPDALSFFPPLTGGHVRPVQGVSPW